MGTWGMGILENDLAMDTVDEYSEYIKRGYSIERATDEIFNQSPNCDVTVLALASVQMDSDDLQFIVKEKALKIIDSGNNLKLWKEEAKHSDYLERKKVLEDFKKELLQYKLSDKRIF